MYKNALVKLGEQKKHVLECGRASTGTVSHHPIKCLICKQPHHISRGLTSNTVCMKTSGEDARGKRLDFVCVCSISSCTLACTYTRSLHTRSRKHTLRRTLKANCVYLLFFSLSASLYSFHLSLSPRVFEFVCDFWMRMLCLGEVTTLQSGTTEQSGSLWTKCLVLIVPTISSHFHHRQCLFLPGFVVLCLFLFGAHLCYMYDLVEDSEWCVLRRL